MGSQEEVCLSGLLDRRACQRLSSGQGVLQTSMASPCDERLGCEQGRRGADLGENEQVSMVPSRGDRDHHQRDRDWKLCLLHEDGKDCFAHLVRVPRDVQAREDGGDDEGGQARVKPALSFPRLLLARLKLLQAVRSPKDLVSASAGDPVEPPRACSSSQSPAALHGACEESRGAAGGRREEHTDRSSEGEGQTMRIGDAEGERSSPARPSRDGEDVYGASHDAERAGEGQGLLYPLPSPIGSLCFLHSALGGLDGKVEAGG
mmetsp:Transcript_38492/g.121272  ORF Transcript_38492/g.121272 Transcript_38492/m.121272 type:complete len:262 (+) Transcript_38492:1004-1789(+)